jgi:uncharacterized protein with NRDE domain
VQDAQRFAFAVAEAVLSSVGGDVDRRVSRSLSLTAEQYFPWIVSSTMSRFFDKPTAARIMIGWENISSIFSPTPTCGRNRPCHGTWNGLSRQEKWTTRR